MNSVVLFLAVLLSVQGQEGPISESLAYSEYSEEGSGDFEEPRLDSDLPPQLDSDPLSELGSDLLPEADSDILPDLGTGDVLHEGEVEEDVKEDGEENGEEDQEEDKEKGEETQGSGDNDLMTEDNSYKSLQMDEDIDGAIDESIEASGDLNNNIEGSTDNVPLVDLNNFEGSTDDIPLVDLGNNIEGSTENVPLVDVGNNFEGSAEDDPSSLGYEEVNTDSYIAIYGSDLSEPENMARECEDSEYGCCEETDFPAHGSNQEGCCLGSEFSCCPDNIRSSGGPGQEGCGCETSKFGCCSDGKKAQREDGEGCGCASYEFGCCQDQHTKAQGEDYEGCPCQTFDFGCCEDGETNAEGPNKEGCQGCQASEFGCCPDKFTPAQGADMEGCGCAGSEFGCCPDGENNSAGQEFEACATTPGEACYIKKDKGTCEDFSVSWYFDGKEGRCSRFWYGGCDGNSNRFEDSLTCEQTCVNPPGSGRCYLPKVRGICTGDYERFYYDSTYKQCVSFSYGGCLGNANKFESKLECDQACVRSDNLAICEQPQESGPCTGNFTRWFYDEGTGECSSFAYGGCHGNKNRFMNQQECENSCMHKKLTMETTNLCRLEILAGSCNETQARWGFNPEIRKCLPFYYSGCEGNENNFNTVEECETMCPDAFPPELEVVNKILNVEEGQEAVLEISVEGNPFPEIEWQHDAEAVEVGEKYILREDRSLVISSVTMEEAGSWMVLANNGLGKVARKQISLSVYPSQIPITVEIPTEQHTYDTGSTIRLECQVSGFPIPSLQWLKNNARLPKSKRIFVEDERFLVIKNASPIDGGAYICLAANENMQNRAVADITVLQGEVPIQCIDKPKLANCALIVRAQYCSKSEQLAKLCCESCVAAGQIAGPPAL